MKQKILKFAAAVVVAAAATAYLPTVVPVIDTAAEVFAGDNELPFEPVTSAKVTVNIDTDAYIISFKYGDTTVSNSSTFNYTAGEYNIISKVPLEVINTTQNVAVSFDKYYYAADAYYSQFTITDEMISEGSALRIKKADNDLKLADLTLTDGAKSAMNSLNMIMNETGFGIGMSGTYPNKIETGYNYEILSTQKLVFTGAENVSYILRTGGTYDYTVTVPESTEALIIDAEISIEDCSIKFYDSDNKRIYLERGYLYYTGSDLTPAKVVITDGDYTLVENTDFTIIYSGDWINISEENEDGDIDPTAGWGISGIGKYSGGTGQEFCIFDPADALKVSDTYKDLKTYSYGKVGYCVDDVKGREYIIFTLTDTSYIKDDVYIVFSDKYGMPIVPSNTKGLDYIYNAGYINTVFNSIKFADDDVLTAEDGTYIVGIAIDSLEKPNTDKFSVGLAEFGGEEFED